MEKYTFTLQRFTQHFLLRPRFSFLIGWRHLVANLTWRQNKDDKWDGTLIEWLNSTQIHKMRKEIPLIGKIATIGFAKKTLME